ncbi:MAG: putative cytochrome c oxidase subunit 1-alpha [Acidimicrobiales bacterium]|nr:putative cytochrome c oxidase subunit 1-alpha [Acidimicrobiales bacterium]
MAMTETRPAPEATAEAPPPAVVADPSGLAGWFSTSDHKRIGRLWIATSLLFLLTGGVLVALLGFEGTASGLDLFDRASFLQANTLATEALVLLFLAPLFLGIATFVVPLQVGSPEIAFPRGSAAAFWLYLVSAGILVASYLADGGPTGGSRDAVDLWLLALIGVLLSLCIGLVSVLTTALTMRAPGMSLLRAPAFTWSVLVGGSLVLLSAPVLIAGLADMYVSHHFGGDLGNYQRQIAWFWSIPTVYLLAVPAAGVALEVVPVLARNRVRKHEGILIVLGLLGIVGVGAWAQSEVTFDDLLYVAMGLAAVLPALALLGLVGDTLRGGKPAPKAALLFAVGTVLLLLLGAVAGALLSIDGLKLHNTTWELGQTHLIVLGAGTVGGLGALWWWAPKLWGVELPESAGILVFLASFGGAVLLAGGELVNGLANDLPLRAATFTDDSVKVLNGISAAGGVLVTLAGLLTVLVLLGAARRRNQVVVSDNPWGGWTLEWATTSPPPPSNFSAPVPVVASATPLLDEVTA